MPQVISFCGTGISKLEESASTWWMPLLPRWPIATLTFDLQNPVRS